MYGLRIISAKEVYENKYKVIIASHAYNDIGKQLINLGCQYVEVFFLQENGILRYMIQKTIF